jgi:hypothetical protein
VKNILPAMAPKTPKQISSYQDFFGAYGKAAKVS